MSLVLKDSIHLPLMCYFWEIEYHVFVKVLLMPLSFHGTSLIAQLVKNLPAMQETLV